MYVYVKSSPTTWTVGFYTNEGERWNAESDHFSEEEAQKQVSYLNGNSSSEVSALKSKLAEVEGERDALRECGSKLHVMYDLNSILYKALENIANQGYSFDGAANADLAKRALALYEDRSK